MVLHRQQQHHNHSSQQLDIDAIPMLQARDELPLLYQDDHMRLLSRRKRHSGGEYSSNSNSGSTSANLTSFVRRRGRSVPCDTRDVASAGGSATADADAVPFVRTRAGSAAAALSGRRRAASSILQHFRRRKDDAQSQEQRSQRQQQMPLAQQQRAKRRVHFKTSLHAEVIPNRYAHMQSYDELLFNVGGLYQTLSFLHDPLPVDDGGSSSTDSNSSHALGLDDLLPPERSMQLMIAEFLYRSAVYLGYACENKPWIPGFRELKRFSVNDVKRWRRLAHYDWEKEEQQCDAMRLRKDSTSTSTSSHASGSGRLRAVVSSWLQRRRHSAPAKMTRAMNSPPPVPPTTDLSLLVTIANSCVYCGTFQFSVRDIRILCNVDIESKAAPGAA